MTLNLDIRPSRLYLSAITIIYGSIFLLLCLLPMAFVFRAVLLAGFFACLWSATRNWQSLKAVRRLVLEQGRLRLLVDGRQHRVEVGKSTLVHPWLVILPVRNACFRSTLLLFPDTANADDLRRLRVWLKGGSKEI